jgi:hypothetical protein
MNTKNQAALLNLFRALPLLFLVAFSLACTLPPMLQSIVSPTPTPTLPPTPTPTPEPLPPTLVETDPLAGADLPLEGSVTLYFSQPMDRASVEAAISVQDGGSETIAGRFDWPDDATLVFEPDQALPPSTSMTIDIAPSARAANGLSLLGPIQLSYQTAPPLKAVQFFPEGGLTEIDPTSAVGVAFNQPVVALGADPKSLPAALILDPAPAGRGEWVNTSTYMFYPDPALSGGASYTARLNPDLVANTGAHLAAATEWQFSTVSPYLVSVEPNEESGSIPLDASFTLAFNQPMDTASVEQHLALVGPNGQSVPGNYVWEQRNTVVTFTPTDLLSRGSDYRLDLSGQAQALGGTPLGSDRSVSLRTVPGLMAIATDPLPGGIKNTYQSVMITFSGPLVEQDDWASFLQFDPQVPNLNAWLGEDHRTLMINGSFTPMTDYRLTLSSQLSDPWGSTLGMEYPLAFRTSALDPEVRVKTAGQTIFLTPQESAIAFQATNLNRLDLALGSVSFEDYLRFLQPDGFEFRQNYQPGDQRSWSMDLDLPGDQIYDLAVPLVPDDEQGLRPGIYFLRLNAPAVDYLPGPFVLISSNIHLTFKLSPTEALVWAVDLRTNTPVSGAPIAVHAQDGTLLASGTTDQDGVFQSPIPSQENLYETYYAVLGRPGDENFAFSQSDWKQGVDGYDFGFSMDLTGPDRQIYLYTDRPIYRPGQTVSFRAVVRQAYNGRYTPANVDSLPMTIYDHDNQIVHQGDYPLSDFDTANGSFTLSEQAQPGTYQISAEGGSVWFDVADYRKPEIDVQVAIPDQPDQILADQSITGEVNARYFFDAPAGELPLTWRLSKQRETFSLPGYHVGPESYAWTSAFYFGDRFSFYGETVDSGEARTNSQGLLTMPLAIPPEEQPQRYTLEATITDESGYPVSGRQTWTVHPADFYIGVRPDTWLGQAGEEIVFEVLTVDWNRDASPDRDLVARFREVSWRREETSDPYMSPELTPDYTPVANTDFRTGADGLARLAFTPPEPGTYQLDVRGDDGAVTQITLWIGGPGQASWPNLPNQRLRLSADQEAYAPGDTAEIFIPNPFGDGAQALITVERSVVSRHFVLTLDDAGYTLSLPLSEQDAPNVYVSVTLLGRRGERHDFRQGYLNLPVEPVAQALDVEVTAIHAGETVTCESGVDCADYLEPRQDVTIALRVTDAQGNPVQGEFTLAVADLAALALADPNSEDILDAFYGQQPLGVNTGIPLTVYAHRLVFIPGGMGGGGDEMLPPFVREEFPDTAYWNAQIVTDANGEAEVTFTLPDNLTTWHLDVRGLTTDTRVGQTESHIVTRKELLVRPVAPRFMVVDDHLRLAAIVHNNSAHDVQVDVALQASGFRLDDPATELQTVSLAAGGRQRVTWWGTVEDVEAVSLVFSASGQDSAGTLLYQDMTKPEQGDIPVVRYTALQSFGTAGVLDSAGERLELISLPRSYDSGTGDLTLNLSPSLAAAMTAGLDSLEHMPYECIEQTVSRFLPNLEAYRAVQTLGLESSDLQARLDRTLDEGLERLANTQNEDGGWGWWPGGESDAYITAYVLFGLSRTEGAGVFVDEDLIQSATDYLLATLPTPEMVTEGWQLDRLAFQYYVLSQAGVNGFAGPESLYPIRDQLNPWAQAMLALTLESFSPGDDRARTLLADLETAAIRSATGAHWEGGGNRRNMETAVFNTAAVVHAIAQLDPASTTLPEAVRYLMNHRDARGAWDSTYETAWTLMALTQFMQGTGELAGDFAFSASVNQTPLVQGQAGGDTRLNAVTSSLPVVELYPDYPNALRVQRDEGPGRLYYTAHLNVARPVADAPPMDAGISVERSYQAFALEGDESASVSVSSAAVGEMIQVHLTLTLENEAYYLAVEDHIPAGAEILDANLKTSQQIVEEPEPPYDPSNPFENGWGWWYFNDPQIYADRITWSVEYLPAGNYELTYTLTLNQPGQYQVLPARAWQFYFPEVQGTSAGMIFEIVE